MSQIKKILVVRNDKIGDFVLALPSIQLIKKAFPQAKITALVPGYTQDIASSFLWIDDVIIDTKNSINKKRLVLGLKDQNFDAVLCLFSDSYNATLVRQAKIPIRVAPATKWVQFLYTHTLRQRRSQSLKPEFEYNLDLARYFIEVLGGRVESDIDPMFFYDADTLSSQLVKLEKVGVNNEYKRCFIHPVTGGSSNTLLLEQWAVLIKFLNTLDTFHFVITAGPGEALISQALVALVKDEIPHVSLYDKNDGVSDFMCSIATADLFIAGSTGPLHIAGAMNVPTIGFYPKKRSSTPLRWKTLNTEGRWLPLSPNEQEGLLTNMDVSREFEEIKNWYLNLAEKR
ncbi:MAG: glycosyltransferase family 9 protein [Marinomonas colpomeniae]